tara:strand:+ start:211 stop:450 length:240 start_codon:yes stop_codon:yes gene_type:complete
VKFNEHDDWNRKEAASASTVAELALLSAAMSASYPRLTVCPYGTPADESRDVDAVFCPVNSVPIEVRPSQSGMDSFGEV